MTAAFGGDVGEGFVEVGEEFEVFFDGFALFRVCPDQVLSILECIEQAPSH